MTGQPGSCAVAWCPEEVVEETLFGHACGHLGDARAGRLFRLADETYVATVPPAERRIEPVLPLPLA